MRSNYLRRLALFVLLFGGCVRLDHVEPKPRTEIAQLLTSVSLNVQCGNGEFWADNKSGSGVVISERHALTALHVVACPMIPNVHVTFVTGNGLKTLRMYVIKEDEDQDIAKLEIASAEYFHFNVPPPSLWTEADGNAEGEGACAYPDRGGLCGIVDTDNTVIKGMSAQRGDSGSAVYTQGLNYTTEQYTGKWGLMLGLIIRKGDGYTRIARVTPEWLEGT